MENEGNAGLLSVMAAVAGAASMVVAVVSMIEWQQPKV
jgi:hypothetical protein